MPCLAGQARGISTLGTRTITRLSRLSIRQLSTSKTANELRKVPTLSSWEPDVFEKAYKQSVPGRLPYSKEHLPSACSRWFIHDNNPDFHLFSSDRGQEHSGLNVPSSSELRTAFWSEHESTFVPLEVTTRKDNNGENFERIEAPLKILLAYLSNAPAPFRGPSQASDDKLSIYLAQCELSALPQALQDDVPVPRLLRPSTVAGIKGDIYASSLWLGRPPTYTPLHRDPNPNLFIQLSGRKTIRLLPPEIGEALYHDVMTSLTPDSLSFSSRIRGDEMMAGPQKIALHDAIWEESSNYNELVRTHCQETTLGLGDTLFTPKGWWHSVKGIGTGITASVNWWFR
ncbi:hypothetical protein H2200_008797 [Cladophialophora chaetospira]|uniref:JmjC domain-containing protein n=1 Tax=Cladophialophora chaetospira TaxID=386627 RepID=A0AA39CFM6_9EURO|nr:hypothetical protein H2200_008797 [Cladophialophora chaetospira]